MIREKVLNILEEVCGTDEVKKNPDIPLFSEGLLDSFGTIQLLIAIDEELKLEIAPSEVTRAEWATPNMIISYLEGR